MSATKAQPEIRRLHAGDRDAWGPLWDGYLSFYRSDVTAAVTEQTFQRLCDEELGMLGLVAVDGGNRPIGLAHLVFHPSTWSSSDYCYLEDLYVDSEYRGRRVATSLFEAVYSEARSRGVERVYWHTQQYNGPARSLYDTVGQLTSFVLYEHLAG
jgi:GNAT superfamily N-acetyltransferase